MGRTCAVYALTGQGALLAGKLAQALGAELFVHERHAGSHKGCQAFSSLAECVAREFGRHDGHVFVAATGIVVRVIAPLLQSKRTDPAVAVLDQAGNYCISLLSGHVGGANDLAREVAAITGGQAVITTATDVEGLPALDVLAEQAGLTAATPRAFTELNAALLAGEPLQIFDPWDILGLAGLSEEQTRSARDLIFRLASLADWDPARPGAVVTHLANPLPGVEDQSRTLVLRPRCLALGMGCRRGADAEAILRLIREVFTDQGLAREAVAIVASIEAKQDEPGLLQAAQELGARTVFYPAEELARVETPNPSDTVEKHMGVKSVSEASALLAAKAVSPDALLVQKTKGHGATLAVALLRQPMISS